MATQMKSRQFPRVGSDFRKVVLQFYNDDLKKKGENPQSFTTQNVHVVSIWHIRRKASLIFWLEFFYPSGKAPHSLKYKGEGACKMSEAGWTDFLSVAVKAGNFLSPARLTREPRLKASYLCEGEIRCGSFHFLYF